MPELGGAVAWLDSAPLNRESLRGKVVLVNFWTYSCIKCINSFGKKVGQETDSLRSSSLILASKPLRSRLVERRP